MVVTIATSSEDKAALLRACLPDARVELVDLPEPQADDIADVARAKAIAARARFGGTVVVEDSGLVIPSLGGFPGPYTKYALATIGARGIGRLAAGAPCVYRSCVAIGGEAIAVGTHEIAGSIAEASTGALWELFVPHGETLPFARLPAEARARYLGALRDAIRRYLVGQLI